MRVLVCGGRDFSDREKLHLELDTLHRLTPISCVIHGAARGADSLAAEWAAERHISIEEFAADWAKQGRAAGPIRNATMLSIGRPELVVAFPGGKGTANMVQQARKAGLRVQVVT